MGDLYNKLKEYLSTATQEQLDEDWKKLKHWNKIGPVLLSDFDFEEPKFKSIKYKIKYNKNKRISKYKYSYKNEYNKFNENLGYYFAI